MEYDLLIREAEAQDASAVIALLDQIGQETSFTSLDENGIAMSESEMQHFLDKQAQSDNQITLLAFLNDELVGIINTTAESTSASPSYWRVSFLGIKKKLTGGNGLGSILMEETIEWAKSSGVFDVLQFDSSKKKSCCGASV